MKERLKFLIEVYILFITFFVVFKPIFMLKYLDIYSQTPISEWFNIMYQGFSMDIAVTSYIISPVILFLIASIWCSGKWFKYLNLLTQRPIVKSVFCYNR